MVSNSKGKHWKLSEESKKNISNGAKKAGNGKWMKGRKFSLVTRKKMGLARKGEKHWCWKGGISPENKIIRKSLEYKLWREAVFERDKYTCVWCGKKSGDGRAVILHPDHIKSFAHYPELRFAIDNGRTLCVDCHETTENYKGKGKRKINERA